MAKRSRKKRRRLLLLPPPTYKAVIAIVIGAAVLAGLLYFTPPGKYLLSQIYQSNSLSIVLPTPLRHWKLDSGSGTIAGDSSSAKSNGALVNMDPATVWTAPGAPTNFSNPRALTFDGTDDYVEAANVAFNGQMSGSLWVKPSSTKVAQVLVDSGEYTLMVTNSQRLRIQVNTTGGYDQTDSTTTLQPGVWYHVAWTYDGTTTKIYVNGGNQSNIIRDTADGPMRSDGLPLNIGVRSTALTSPFSGSLDDVRLYQEVLSSAQVRTLAAGSAVVPLPNLLGYWKFEEGSGTTTADASGNGLTGELTNMEANDWDSSNTTGDGEITSDQAPVGTGIENDAHLIFNNDSATTGDPLKINESVTMGAAPELDFGAGDSFTWSAWFRSTTSASRHTIASKKRSVSFATDPGYASSIYSSDKHLCFLGDGTKQVFAASTVSVTDGVWHHGVCVIDRQTNLLSNYIDGVLSGVVDIASIGSSATPAAFRIGLQDLGTAPLRGHADDVRVYDGALSAEQVEALATGGTLLVPCAPRPACLDATPGCLLPEPVGGWCPPLPSPPTISLKLNNTDGAANVDYNTEGTLSWTGTNVTTCTATGTGWSGARGASGTESTGKLTTSKTYNILCRGPGGTAIDSVRANISTFRECSVGEDPGPNTGRDLTWGTITMRPTYIKSGSLITVDAEMKNVGNSDAGPFYLATVYDKYTDDAGNNKLDDTVSTRQGNFESVAKYTRIAGLKAGEKRTFRATITNTTVTSLLRHNFRLYLNLAPANDTDTTISDTNPGNNRGTCSFDILQ